jgi:hypothetical protein
MSPTPVNCRHVREIEPQPRGVSGLRPEHRQARDIHTATHVPANSRAMNNHDPVPRA